MFEMQDVRQSCVHPRTLNAAKTEPASGDGRFVEQSRFTLEVFGCVKIFVDTGKAHVRNLVKGPKALKYCEPNFGAGHIATTGRS
jgi:hypothetical protein